MNELWTILVPPAITGLATVVAALIQSMQNKDSPARNLAGVITVLGPIVTVVLAVGMFTWFYARRRTRCPRAGAIVTAPLLAVRGMFTRFDRTQESKIDRARIDLLTHTLNKFPESSSEIRANQIAPDLDARAVRDGAGPDRWQLPDGTSIGKGQVFYVDGWRWVDVVFPADDREDPDATCGIEALGTLTTRGFSSDRNAALVEYTAPGDTAGTPCETGTYFFYPLPLTQ